MNRSLLRLALVAAQLILTADTCYAGGPFDGVPAGHVVLSPGGNGGAASGRDGGIGEATLVGTLTASASASLDFTGLSANNYRLRCREIVPATAGAGIQIVFGEGGTPTWKTDANYQWAGRQETSGAGTSHIGSTTDTGLTVNNSLTLFAANLPIDVTVSLYHLQSTVSKTMAEWSTITSASGAAKAVWIAAAGEYDGDTIAKTALRVIATSGNITSGNCSLYQINS